MSAASTTSLALAAALPALPERLTHEQADAYVQRCQAAIEGGRATDPGAAWPLDASALQHFDSSALAALLAVSRLLQARGGRLQVQHMPLRLRELAALYGVSELLAA
ncbi:predicted NTP binding protein containing STAS domain [Serpentinimonas raichei]|uniref:Predicted NTP binding protein containing STAS domain n=1 Tax=Serpentinimonas raichei TaxID=1458425 RepID=A0A060NMI7_9BURK|nr:STAS domain-containing protein [Serpentinimonas raichei]BAO80139.1 predicted NTP binding protein containing STAS domain [Serpentinimonas raichei]